MEFEIGYAVVLDRPIDAVFPVLAFADDAERLVGLSPMLTSFTLLDPVPDPAPDPASSTRVFGFEFTERVPILAGLWKTDVAMRVEQTVDVDARCVDYRSRSVRGVGITVHKIRTFESVGARTRVSEVVHGEAPPGLHLIARRSARQQHRLHMDRYAELF